MWDELGFSESPYATTALPPSERGDILLVGRDRELESLLNTLRYTSRHATIEGDNGVGKTSLVAIAAYRAKQERLQREKAQFLLPLEGTFQLSPDDTVDAFRRRVAFQVARAFIREHAVLRAANLNVPDVDEIDRWLNSPLFRSAGGGVSILGSGVSGERSTDPNTSTGFSEDGFVATIERWLDQCFPGSLTGGFICVLDNLELLETSQAARQQLERLRDSVLAQKGLRWVLCGATGVVRSAASSPRLEGHLADPINLEPIPDDVVAEVVSRRLDVFSIRTDAYAPVEPDGFKYLYDVLNRNLRNALRYAEEFALGMVRGSARPGIPEEKVVLLRDWLRQAADRHHRDTHGVGRRAWEVFEGLVVLDGRCSPGDYEQFGFNSPMAMRPHIRSLEEANLVQSAIDDTDHRRKTIAITPRGWLVQYKLSNYEPWN
jgi:hypothetical protein